MPGVLGQNKGRKAVYIISFVSPLDQNPDPNNKPYFQMKKHHDLMFVIELESSQNSFDLYQATLKMEQKGS